MVLPALGHLFPYGHRSPRHFARELRNTHVGIAALSHRRDVDQQLLGCYAYFRRRLAQQSPCVTAVGSSRKVSIAAQKLLVDVSPVRKRCDPHMCVAEFTSQVEWRPMTVREKMPQSRQDHPPIAKIARPRTANGTQCHLLIQT